MSTPVAVHGQLPALHDLVTAACEAAGWQVTLYDGTGSTADVAWEYTGLLALRGDLRAQAEWHRDMFPGGRAGRWRAVWTEMAVRHPRHDIADFAGVTPRAWRRPVTADLDRRVSVASVYGLVRLLELDDNSMLADAVAEAAGKRPACLNR